MGTYIDEDDLRQMGYVCTECGEPETGLKSCPKGCTKVCADCLRRMNRSFVFCKKCGDMTLQRWRGSD